MTQNKNKYLDVIINEVIELLKNATNANCEITTCNSHVLMSYDTIIVDDFAITLSNDCNPNVMFIELSQVKSMKKIDFEMFEYNYHIKLNDETEIELHFDIKDNEISTDDFVSMLKDKALFILSSDGEAHGSIELNDLVADNCIIYDHGITFKSKNDTSIYINSKKIDYISDISDDENVLDNFDITTDFANVVKISFADLVTPALYIGVA